MKRAFFLGLVYGSIFSVCGQGLVIFNNIGVGLKAPVYGPEPGDTSLAKSGNTSSGIPAGTQTYTGPLLSGSAWRAQLYAAPGADQPVSALLAGYPVNTFRTGAAAGFLLPEVIATLTGVPGDSEVATVQMRAWDNSTGLYPNWSDVETALTNGGILLHGESQPFNVYGVGGFLNPQPYMTNLCSFNVHYPQAPSNNTPPLLIFQPASQAAYIGSTAAFSVGVVGSPPLGYQWLTNGTEMPDATNASLVLVNVQTNDSGLYAVRVSNPYGLATSSNAILSVIPESPRITTQPQSQTVALANNVTFSVAAVGMPPLSYQWLKDGTELSGATGTSCTITNVQTTNAGVYNVLVSSPYGSVVSSNAVLTVVERNVIAWGDNSFGQCNVPLSATNVIDIAAGGPGHTVALCADGTVVGWGGDGVGNPPASATNVVAVASGWSHNLALRGDGSVIAWGANNYGQTQVPASATNVIAIAAGYFFNLALKADGTVVAWGKGDFYSGPTAVPPAATNLAWVGAGACQSFGMRTDGTLMFWGTDYLITLGIWAVPATRFPGSWKDVQMVSGGLMQNLVLTPGGRVLAWGGRVKVPAFATNVTVMVAGTNFNVALQDCGQVIAWGMGAVTNVPAYATNAVAIAAGSKHGVAVTALQAPPKILGPVQVGYRTEASAGNRLPLYVRAVGSQPLHYQWLANGAPVAGTDSPFPQILASLGTADVQYRVVVSNPFGSVTSAVAQVTVRPLSAWGANLYGQDDWPARATNVTALAAGAFHCLTLGADGTVLGFGKNRDGQATVPAGLANVAGIAAGGDHSLALKGDGSVSAWGRNWDGQTDVPATATNVVTVSAGWAHSLALRADGTVLAWGNNDCGQTNVQLLPEDIVTVAAGYYHNVALRSDGTVVTWGWDVPTPSATTNVTAVAAGREHCLVLRADGTVVAWGDNSYGQCQVPATATNVVAIAAGCYADLALRADGTLVAWGKPSAVLAGTPAGGGFTLIAAGEDYSLAFNGQGAPCFPQQRSDFAPSAGTRLLVSPVVSGSYPMTFQWYHEGAVVAGATNRSLVLDNLSSAGSGNYVLMATNATGQAGSQTFTIAVRSAPTLAGRATRRNVPVGGSVCLEAQVFGAGPMSYQWQRGGTNLADVGRFSGVNARVLCLSAAEPGDTELYSVVAGNAYGSVTGDVAQVVVSEIVAWGDNTYGQLDAPPNATGLAGISAGGQHNLALRNDGTVVAWGDDSFGQIDVPPDATNLIAVAAGEKHSLGLRADDSVIAWGDNSYGQTTVPAEASNVVAIAAGSTHSLALRVDGTVVVWGDRLQTDVPWALSKVVAIAAGAFYSAALKLDGSVVGWGVPSRVPAGITNGAAVAVGGAHALVLSAGGSVVAGGAGYYGQTLVPAFGSQPTAIAAGGDHSLALLADGTIIGWGGDYSGQTDVPAAAFGARTISAGGAHSLALMGTNSAPPVLSGWMLPGSVAFVLKISGLSGKGPIAIYRSSNLVDWELIATYPPVFGQLQILDRLSASPTQRFFRVQELR